MYICLLCLYGYTYVCVCVHVKQRDKYKVSGHTCMLTHVHAQSSWSVYLYIKLAETEVENNLLLIKFLRMWNLAISEIRSH